MDWTGDSNSVFKMLGASNHSNSEREANDFYATDPMAIDKLVSAYQLPEGKVWECACGAGHLVGRLSELGYDVVASDLFDRGCGEAGVDFLSAELPEDVTTIITNPPYKYANDFILRALHLLPNFGVCAMLLRIQALEGMERYERIYSKYPPQFVLVFTKRLLCAKNGDFNGTRRNGGSALAYGWFIWVKHKYTTTKIIWI